MQSGVHCVATTESYNDVAEVLALKLLAAALQCYIESDDHEVLACKCKYQGQVKQLEKEVYKGSTAERGA